MGDMGEVFRDWKEFWRERRDINEQEALQHFEEIGQYAEILRYDKGQRTLLLSFKGRKLHYYLARGRWYLSGDKASVDGGVKAFIGWLKNNTEPKVIGLEKPQTKSMTLTVYDDVETNEETAKKHGFLKVKKLSKDRAITVGPLNPKYDEEDPFK